MPKVMIRALSGVVAACLLPVLSGCGNSTASKVAAMNQSNIQRLANLYAACQMQHGGAGPKDDAEFKAFVKGFQVEKLQMMGVDTNKIDDLFTSPRDHQPFEIRYEVKGGFGATAPVIFEKDGVGGKKQVGYTGGKVEEVDAATAQKLFSGEATAAGSAPAASQPAPAEKKNAQPWEKRQGPKDRPKDAPTGPPK